MSVEHSEVIPPCAIDHIHVPLVFEEAVLDERPPYRIESALGHTVELFDPLIMPLIQMLDNAKEPASIIIRRERPVVILCDNKFFAYVRFSRRRGVHSKGLDAMLGKVRLEVFPVTVIRIFEEQDRVDDVAPEK